MSKTKGFWLALGVLILMIGLTMAFGPVGLLTGILVMFFIFRKKT